MAVSIPSIHLSNKNTAFEYLYPFLSFSVHNFCARTDGRTDIFRKSFLFLPDQEYIYMYTYLDYFSNFTTILTKVSIPFFLWKWVWKSAGLDLITAEILLEIPNNILMALTNLLNCCHSLKYVPIMWKVAEVIMIPKPGKPPNIITSYRPISLLPVLSKLLEKMFQARLMPIINRKELIPKHQFGFRESHSTIDQVHRIVKSAGYPVLQECWLSLAHGLSQTNELLPLRGNAL